MIYLFTVLYMVKMKMMILKMNMVREDLRCFLLCHTSVMDPSVLQQIQPEWPQCSLVRNLPQIFPHIFFNPHPQEHLEFLGFLRGGAFDLNWMEHTVYERHCQTFGSPHILLVLSDVPLRDQSLHANVSNSSALPHGTHSWKLMVMFKSVHYLYQS